MLCTHISSCLYRHGRRDCTIDTQVPPPTMGAAHAATRNLAGTLCTVKTFQGERRAPKTTSIPFWVLQLLLQGLEFDQRCATCFFCFTLGAFLPCTRYLQIRAWGTPTLCSIHRHPQFGRSKEIFDLYLCTAYQRKMADSSTKPKGNPMGFIL